VIGIVRRWWPIPVAVALSIVVQTNVYTGRYDVSGHAAEHLSSGSFVFLATVVAGVLLWTTPAARRSPFVLVGLATWLGAGVAIAIGNVRVVDVLIDAGQATTSTEGLVESSALSDSHWLANTAPFFAVAGAFAVVLGVYLVRAASARLACVAAVFNVLIPYWIVPGFGVVLLAIARTTPSRRRRGHPEGTLTSGAHDPVPTPGLRLVQSSVSVAKDGLDVTDTGRSSHADRDRDQLVQRPDGFSADTRPHSLAQRGSPLGVGGRDHDEELLPAPPAGNILVPARRGEAAGHLAQNCVSRLVAESIVDALEVIDVHHQDAHGSLVSSRRRAGGVQVLLEVPAVREAGERVDAADGLELVVANPQLVLQTLDSQRGADAGEQLSRLEGLAQVVVRSESQTFDDILRGRTGGEEHDGDVDRLRVPPELDEHAVTVEVGHLDVEEDDVRWILPADAQCVQSVDGFDDLVPVLLELLSQHGANHQRIVGHEDARMGSLADHAFSLPRSAAGSSNSTTPRSSTMTPAT
jgi:hypothetical protein